MTGQSGKQHNLVLLTELICDISVSHLSNLFTVANSYYQPS